MSFQRVNLVKAFKLIIPIMFVVGTFSWMMLERKFTEVPETSRLYITIGAVIMSGIISYFLFPKNEEKES
jgi:hypothetical protein